MRFGSILRVLGALGVAVLVTGATLPPNSEFSANWFNSLPDDSRLDIQADLVLTGDYGALVDGEFGPATFAALKRYQARRGEFQNGYLSKDALDHLDRDAHGVMEKLGIDLIQDQRSGLSIFLPKKLLTEVKAQDGGTVYSTGDGGLVLTTVGYPTGGATLEDLRDALTAAGDGGVVAYQTIRGNTLVVSLRYPDHNAYALFYQSHENFTGYLVNWVPDYDQVGTIVAIFAASYSVPTGDLPVSSPEQVRTAGTSPPAKTYTSPGARVGPFLIPSVDNTIVLDGELTEGTLLDFLRALRDRPKPSALLLNSPGGNVAGALMLAHEVNQRGIPTRIETGAGCYSACAFVFFAGSTRRADGSLGVHQIYGDGATAESAQFSLSDILDALREYDVSQNVISIMLRTPPDQIHIFTSDEIGRFQINRADFGVAANTSGLAGDSNATVAAIDPAAVPGTQALLLEASEDGATGAAPFSGTVDWQKGVDDGGQPTLTGRASIPTRNLSVSILIRKNTDPSRSASHLMEINFTVSDSFTGGSIAGLPAVLLKDEELIQGTPLMGASTRVNGNSFVFALSDAADAKVNNSALLASKKWMDIALIYASGKRAILTLEEDDRAQDLFRSTVAAWWNPAAGRPDGGVVTDRNASSPLSEELQKIARDLGM